MQRLLTVRIRALTKLHFYYEMSLSLRRECRICELFAFAPQRNYIFIIKRHFRGGANAEIIIGSYSRLNEIAFLLWNVIFVEARMQSL